MGNVVFGYYDAPAGVSAVQQRVAAATGRLVASVDSVFLRRNAIFGAAAETSTL